MQNDNINNCCFRLKGGKSHCLLRQVLICNYGILTIGSPKENHKNALF